MILRQVREGDGVEPHAPHPVLIEGVRGHLHGHDLDPGVAHRGQEPVQVGASGVVRTSGTGCPSARAPVVPITPARNPAARTIPSTR